MGNLENDDIDEKASLKTITSEINSNDVIPDDNSVKSDSVQSKPHGERKIKDKLSKKHKHKKSKKSSKNDVDKVEGNSENVNHINGTVNENNINNISEPQANIQESTRTPVIDTIDTNADVHAEDDPGKTNNIESIKSSDHDDINENIASHNDKANRSNEADKSNFITEEDESNKYTNDEISKIDSQTEDLEPNVVEANTSDTSKYETQPVSYDSQIEDIKPEDKNENQSNVEEKDANQPSEESEHKESVDIRESNDPFQNTNDESSNLIELQTPENDSTSNQETGVGSSDEKQSGNEIDTGNHVKKVENKTQEKSSDIPTIPNDYLMTNGMKTSPKLPRRPLKRSVSDNFIIKSTSTSPHPIIDPLPQCNIDIENEVLIQNNINLYKSDDNLRNLTKLEMLKRSISDTLTNLKSKLMRSNKVTNGNLDQNVKLINVGSQSRTLDGAEEDEMIENIKTPLEMKNGSLESVQDSEVNDKDNAWKVERDISNGIDVLRR
ncbi:hypothetical protein M8J76_009224 [Diaphorina citri]|nr:hypothetical protein M8J75_012521 [Diaphorina citri]KAI5713997.1 hypothetical protein M8J76_009224 [Diaphorina citri]